MRIATRVLALAAAVAMIVGAVALRGAIESDGGGTRTSDGEPAGDPSVVCPSDLADLCRSIVAATEVDAEVLVEDAGATFDRLVEAGPAVAAPLVWLVPRPWPAMVDAARGRTGRDPLFASDHGPIARTTLVLVAPTERAAVLEDACGFDWACVGTAVEGVWADIGGRPGWGRLKPGHASGDGALGLLVVAQAAASQLGGADYTLADLQDPTFRAWFDAVEDATVDVGAPTHLEALLQFGPARLDIVGTTEAEAARLAPLAAQRGLDLRVVTATPPVAVELVIAATAGGDDLAARLAAVDPTVLTEAGWRTGREPPAALPSASPLPAEPGLPAPGSLEALRATWHDVR